MTEPFAAARLGTAIALAAYGAGCTLLFPMGEFDSGDPTLFSERCADPAVVRCAGFDSAAEMAALYGNEPCGAIDTVQFVSGGGSVRIAVSTTGVSSPCAVNFRAESTSNPPALDAGSFGPGETFFVQWRMRFDAPALANDYGEHASDQLIVGPGDEGGVVGDYAAQFALYVSNRFRRGFPTLAIGNEEVAPAIAPTGDFALQNLVSGCTYQNPHYCKRFTADEWMKFQVSVSIGHDGEPDTRVRAWLGQEGAASTPIVDVDGFTLSGNGAPLRFGKVWHWPRIAGLAQPGAVEAHVWYDDLVISRAMIADPVP